MKALRLCVLGVAVLCAALSAAAQEKPGESVDTSSQHTTTTEVAKSPQGMGQQLAHAANEAAGEEADETKEFKESASVRWVASHTGLSLRNAYWLLVILNFAIIAAFIGWAWKKNLPTAFRSRTETIRKSLDEARSASEDANRRLSEIEGRLSRLDADIAEMRKSAEAEAAAEEERIKVAAEQERRNVIASAESDIDAAAKAARRDLKNYAASLAVSLAEKKIKVDAQTDEALVRRFVRELGSNGKDGR
jgi:F-type H+-transporting ATPase subunit b